MAKDLDLTKVSENLTPKERAKLVIALRLKGIEETKNLTLDEIKEMAKKQSLPTQADIIKADIIKIVNACPQEQIREYNAYIELEHRVRNKVLTGIEYDLDYLDALEGRVSQLTYALGISPLTSHALEMVKRLPHLVTKEEYEKGLKKAREIIRQEVREIDGEGNINLAEWEAYYRLKKEGKIKEESTDFLDGWISYIEKYGKTKEELIDEAVKSVKYGLEQHLKYQRRAGKDRYWESYKKYEGLTDKELREAVIKDHTGTDTDISERITAQPTKEEYELWQKTVKEERERILQAVKDGKLKWVKRKEKKYDRETKSWKLEEVEGIELGSYYDWNGRYRKYTEGGNMGYNPFSEDCIELGYIEGKGVVLLGDPSLTEEEEEKEEAIAIATPNTSFYYASSSAVEMTKKMLTQYLEALLPVRVDKDRKKILTNEDTVKIKLSSKEVEEALKAFVKKATETIKNIYNRITLVEAVEKKHFDGMQIASRDPTNPTGSIARALAQINRFTKRHNEHLRGIVKQFNSLDWGTWDYKFEGLDELLINPDQQPDQKQVDEELAEIEEEAGING